MGTKKKIAISSFWIRLILVIIDTSSQSYVEGVQPLDISIFGPKPKGTIKTIEALEVNDIIDCVDIYKQPAFDNPLIKELKTVPSSYQIEFNKTSNSQPKLVQTWHKYGECPTGTIPIKRTSDNNNNTIHRKYHNAQEGREYATMVQDSRKVHGGKAFFSVWNPRVMKTKEFSLAQMWVGSGVGNYRDTVEAGWMVYPILFNDARTRLFVFWASNNYKKGCYNLMCSGFVQTNDRIALGVYLEPISIYNKELSSVYIGLTRSQVGDWWLFVQDQILGYFPRKIFTTLCNGADRIAFGGEIGNLATGGRHTKTVMGSGHFSDEGYKKASHISNIQVLNDHQSQWGMPNLKVQRISAPECYSLKFGPIGTDLGSHFYYGGPGLSPRCQ